MKLSSAMALSSVVYWKSACNPPPPHPPTPHPTPHTPHKKCASTPCPPTPPPSSWELGMGFLYQSIWAFVCVCVCVWITWDNTAVTCPHHPFTSKSDHATSIFSFSLTRDIWYNNSMENLAIDCLLRWKLINLLTTSLYHFLLGWLGEFALWAWDWKG